MTQKNITKKEYEKLLSDVEILITAQLKGAYEILKENNYSINGSFYLLYLQRAADIAKNQGIDNINENTLNNIYHPAHYEMTQGSNAFISCSFGHSNNVWEKEKQLRKEERIRELILKQEENELEIRLKKKIGNLEILKKELEEKRKETKNRFKFKYFDFKNDDLNYTLTREISENEIRDIAKKLCNQQGAYLVSKYLDVKYLIIDDNGKESNQNIPKRDYQNKSMSFLEKAKMFGYII